MKAMLPIIIITVVIALLEAPSLIRQKLGRDLYVFIGLLGFAFILGIMQALKVHIPNPFDWLTFVFNPMTKVIQRILE